LDPKYAEHLGVNIDELLVSQPDTGEQALDIAEILVRSNAVDLIIVDSVAALTPKAEIEGDMGDSHMGLQARLMSQALRKLTAVIAKSRTCMIFINQVREKIGGTGYGPNEVTTGGRALKFYASVRLDIRRIASLRTKEVHFGNRARVKVVKNKLAPPFKTTEFDIIFGEGISRENEILDLGIGLDHINKSGAWFSFGDLRLGQGRDKAAKTLAEDKELQEKVLRLVKEDLKNGKTPKI
ncbi:MAG: recombinase RecA, partial [bacterium]